MKRFESVLSSLTGRILAVDHRPVVVGVDGAGGSGKSTLAREIAEVLPVTAAIVEGDAFYSETSADQKASLSPKQGYEEFFDWRRLRSEILQGIGEHPTTLRYQEYDWDIAAIRGWVEVPMPEVVIVEGVYTLRPELRRHFDVAVFVRASERTRVRRQESRKDNSGFWISRWMAAEDFYASHESPWEGVDFLVDGE